MRTMLVRPRHPASAASGRHPTVNIINHNLACCPMAGIWLVSGYTPALINGWKFKVLELSSYSADVLFTLRGHLCTYYDEAEIENWPFAFFKGFIVRSFVYWYLVCIWEVYTIKDCDLHDDYRFKFNLTQKKTNIRMILYT